MILGPGTDAASHGWMGTLFGALIGLTVRADGTINWPTIINSILSAAIVGLGTMVVRQGELLSAVAARQVLVIERLHALETGNSAATNERYRQSDAARDFARVEARLDKIEERISSTKK